GPMQAPEQLATHVFFQAPHMAADGRLRNMQLACGFSETQAPRASLEGPQSEQGRWALCGHCAEPRWSGYSHEFKLSEGGTQIVCGGRGLGGGMRTWSGVGRVGGTG